MEEKLKEIIKNEVFVTKDKQTIAAPDGSEGNWIFDFRKIFLNPHHINLIAEIFWEKHNDTYPFQVCGLEVAAIPLVGAIVMKSVEKRKPVNGFFIRKSRKKMGLMNMIEGGVNNEKIIIVDDLINTGNSITRQLAVLDGLKKDVHEVFTLMHFREPTCYNFLKERDIIFNSLFPITDFGLPFEKTWPQKFLGNVFKTEWYFKSENPNYFYVVPKSAPALDEDKIYFGSDNGYFWALNQKDGSVVWKYRVGFAPKVKGRAIFSTPAIYDGIVYFGAYDGNVYALDAHTGKREWAFLEADWVDSSPALAPDLGFLFIGLEFGLWNKQGGVVALDLKTGEKKWERVTSALTRGSPAYSKSKGVVVIGSSDSCAYAYNAKNGKLLWKLQAQGEIAASFVFDEKRNTVIFGSLDGTLYVVDIKTGKPIFTHTAEFGIYSTPVIYKDAACFSSLDKKLYSVNLDTRKLNWTFATNGRIFASPIIVSGKIYIGSNDGRLYEIDPDIGKMTGFIQVTERITNRIAYNEKTKRFFLGTFANEIYCLKRKEKEDWENDMPKPNSLPAVEKFNKNEKRIALTLSRKTLELFLRTKNKNIKPDSSVPEKFLKQSSVGVSLWLHGFLRGCQIVSGKKIYDAIIEATKRSARDARFKPLGVDDLDATRIQISIISNRWDEIDKRKIKNLEINHEKGYFLKNGTYTGWYLPEVFNIVQFTSLEHLVRRLATEKAGLDPSAIADENTKIYSFGTDDFMEGVGGDVLDFEGPVMKMETEITETELVNSEKKAAQWMLSRMDSGGGIGAILNPYGRKIDRYDWARSVFSGWTLAEFGKVFNDKACTQAAEKNFTYNKKFIFSDTFNSAVDVKNRLLVLSYLGQQALALGFPSDALLCADTIIKQLGHSPFHPLVFSQIASFLGTMALWGNTKYLEGALRCADAVKNVFDADGIHNTPRSIAEYAEFINTLLILYICTDNKKYADTSKEIVSWILKNQLENGAFKNTESSNFQYTRGTSKVVEVLSLFNAASQEKLGGNYKEETMRAFKWLMSMQYNELNSFFIDSREVKKYLGGFRHDYVNAEAWIDSAAHFILAVARLYAKETIYAKTKKS